MPLLLDEGKKTLVDTIRGDIRHRDYDRVCLLAKKYTAYVTGEDIKDLLIQFNPREDDDAFAQRVAITKLITPYIANRVMTPMYKAGRTLAAKVLTWTQKEKSDEYKKKLGDAIANYYGDMSVDDYLAYRMVELDSTDPNSFIVTDFAGEVDPANPASKAEPYPFEVNSEEAINYKYKNNRLEFLIVLNCSNKLNRFTIYTENDWIIAQQITVDEWKVKRNDAKIEILFKDLDRKEAGDIYEVTTGPHKAGRIPAIRVGTKRDLYTRNRTCVPLIHPANPFFEKSIKIISELDITITKHTFPQKITYDSVCTGDPAREIVCMGGKLADGSTNCPICKGSGFNEHKSAHDIIRVKMPEQAKDIVSLENFITYKHPPIELIEFMKKFGMYELPELAVKAVYTSELFATDTIVSTATEKNIDLESVYDALKPFTDQWSQVYKHTVTVMAAYLSVASGLVIEHMFPKDFKMKTLEQLLDSLTKANTGGAPSYIKKEINKDIAQKLYVDKPEELLKIEVKEKFFPFNGKTESEISMIIINGLCSNFNKILFSNYDLIFDELEQENTTDTVSFYKMELSAQRKLLVKKVEEYQLVIDEEYVSADNFGGADSQDFSTGDPVSFNGAPVQIVSATPGPDGGAYKIKLSDGTEKDVSGVELMAA